MTRFTWLGTATGVLCLSMLLYVASFFTPAVSMHLRHTVYPVHWVGYRSLFGIDLFFWGWLGLLGGNLAVLANPLLWLSWLLFWLQRYGAASVTSAIAVLLSAFVLDLARHPWLFDEAGVTVGYLHAARPGVILWTMSVTLILVASFSFSRTLHMSKR